MPFAKGVYNGMKHKHIIGVRMTVLSAVVAAMLSATGCQSASPQATAQPTTLTHKTTLPPAEELDSPQKTYNEVEGTSPQPKETILANKDGEDGVPRPAPTISNEPTKLPDKEKSNLAANVPDEDKTPAVTPKSQVQSLSENNLTLHNLAIGAHVDQLASYEAALISRYTLGEASDAIEVYDYDGFSVGINKQNKIQFVEIFGEDVPTGLNGLLIGDSPSAVIEALGNPAKQTDYVLNYEFSKTLLKFDLDPESNAVISIKLLSSK